MKQINPMENLSIIKFSVVVESEEHVEPLTKAIGETLGGMLVSFGTTCDPTGDNLWWFAYTAMVKVEDMRPSLLILQELGTQLADDAEPLGFPEGTVFMGSASELIPNGDQTDEAASIEGVEIETHLLSSTYEQHLRSRLLLKRVEAIEKENYRLRAEVHALEENIRANKVMNFQYNQFHNLPRFIYNMVQTIGDEKLKAKWDELFEDDQPFEMVRIH